MSIDPKSLRVGQAVAVREMHYGVQLDPPAAGEAGLTVLQVGPEQLVLDDAAGGSRRSIPLYLIHKPAPAPAGGPEAV
jgi:hypothetical protein